MKAFYLANADVKQTANMIRTVLKTRDVFIDEKIGLLVIKDTPSSVRLAERLIAAQDLAESEVMLEVEVLEVATNRLMELGIEMIACPDPHAVPQLAKNVDGTLDRPTGTTGSTARIVFTMIGEGSAPIARSKPSWCPTRPPGVRRVISARNASSARSRSSSSSSVGITRR